ncbi:Na+/H+ antiporter subunit D [Sinobaca sp. H24]|uniref:Na+/H+ antiporter subunit D n=1 Tax=Sinobaca sp. H24 TaxID=2923376 RepID=UPI00207AA158|nr:Na+/H+ antiporter subunit D [Sinobaca sp. H24]
MSISVILLIVIPFFTGALFVLFPKQVKLQRLLSVMSFSLILAVGVRLLHTIHTQGIQTLELGGWAPPFGIVLVGDMFSTLLVVTSSLLALGCTIYSFTSIEPERERYYYYAFLQFLVTGVNGSFLTGDMFNLFVFFEVMLLASYVLLSLGGLKKQLRAGIMYVLINIVSSMLFIVAIAYLYAVTGTLNMAHLSVRVAEAGQPGILTAIALLFLVIFAVKSALLFFFWLPESYSAPPTAISALFAGLLTKVGVYAIFRMFTLIFYHDPAITHTVIAWMAVATMVLGAVGSIAYGNIQKILSYNIIIAIGFIVIGLAVFQEEAIAGAIYYLMHDMVVKTLLFLLGGAMVGLVGTYQLKEMSGMIRNHPYLGWMFFIASLALVGVPPLSGFFGKLLVLQGSLDSQAYILFTVGLLSSLAVLYSTMKIFMNGFWGENQLSKKDEKTSTRGLLFPCTLLIGVSLFLGVGVELVQVYVTQAASELMNPAIYIEAVLDRSY